MLRLLNDLNPHGAIKTDMLESSETAMWLLQSTGCPRDPEISYASSSQKNHRQKTSKIKLMITCNFPSLRPAPCRLWNFEETNISLENHMQVPYILFSIFPSQVTCIFLVWGQPHAWIWNRKNKIIAKIHILFSIFLRKTEAHSTPQPYTSWPQ